MMIPRLVRHLEKLAPLQLADRTWDNVGLLVECPWPDSANKLFLCNDLTALVAEEALSDPQVGMIIAYHPPIFRPISHLTHADEKQSILLKCIHNNVSVYSPHTALDAVNGGVNDWLLQQLGPALQSVSVRPIKETVNAPEGHHGSGLGRIAVLKEKYSMAQITEQIKRNIDLPRIRVAYTSLREKQLIKTVAVCAGSGGSILSMAAAVDLFITGELSHHDILAAVGKGCAVILCEHSNSERGYLFSSYKEKLLSSLASDSEAAMIKVVTSRLDRDPIEIV